MDKQAKFVRQFGLENDGKARQLARYVKETGERYVDNLEVVMVYRPDRFLRGGDHIPYLENGFAAVRVTEMNENFNHQHQDVRLEKGVQYGDLVEFMDFEYLRKNTALNLSNLANLAKAPAVPESVHVEARDLGNTTKLSWKAPVSGKVKGYYILVPGDDQRHLAKKVFTAGTDGDRTVLFSADNYFFAVQSVSETGNESLPIVPLPANGR